MIRRVAGSGIIASLLGSAGMVYAASPAAADNGFNGTTAARAQIASLYRDASDQSAVVAGYPLGARHVSGAAVESNYGMTETRAKDLASQAFSGSPNNWPAGNFTFRSNGSSDTTVWTEDGRRAAEAYCSSHPGKCFFIGHASGSDGDSVPSIGSSRVITGAPGGTKLTVTEKTSVSKAHANTRGFSVGVEASPLKGSAAEGIGKVSFSYNVSTVNTRTEASDHDEKMEVTIPHGVRATLRSFANGQTMGGYLAVMAPDGDAPAEKFRYDRVTMFPVTAFVGFNKAPSAVTWEVIDEGQP